VGHNFFGGQLTGSFTQLEGFTNIVSTGMLVQWPGGSARVIPFFTDIFSRQADFISQIRYLDSDPGNADTSGPYTFTLLDALGDPIPGTTQTDFWTACTQGMPVHFNPVVTPGLDIDLFWDVVPIAPGFKPAVGEGFYQIELYAEPFVPEILFGAHDIGVANHRIPWNDFGGDAPRFEDGRDGGLALSQLDNGDYHVEVMAFSQHRKTRDTATSAL
jgi:hypothetical protein